MSEHNPDPEEQEVFDDEYVRASMGKRLANYIIDLVVFYLVLIVILSIVYIYAPQAIIALQATDKSLGVQLLERLISLILYALYMGSVEAVFKGKSLGKLITRTRAVYLDGSTISAATAFSRGFSRAVPFCVFSAFGNPCNPWQDRWTNTLVAEEEE